MFRKISKKKNKDVIEAKKKLPEPGQLIEALVKVGTGYMEFEGKADPSDPSLIVHPYFTQETGDTLAKSEIISWKPLRGATKAMIKEEIKRDESLQRTIRQCLNLCDTAGVRCHNCNSARPHYHFYFGRANNERGFDIISYPCLDIAVWQWFLENEDEYFIDWITYDYSIDRLKRMR